MRSLAVLTIVIASYGVALAQSGEEDAAKAEKIFEDAQKLKQDGKTADACKKYEESLHYNHAAVGTLLNVALCAEEAGKVATALKYFTQARDFARENNLAEHRKAAEEHAAKLQPMVPHLGISFTEIAKDMKVVIDEDAIPIEKAGDIPLDPGSHHIAVSAPGRVSYETTVTIEANKPPTSITVPALGLPVTVKQTRRTVGKILTFSGVALGATSVVLGFVAKGQYQEQIDNMNCTDTKPPMCNADGYQKTGNARTIGNVGTVVAITGGVALGVGAYLWFFAPKEQVAVVPTADGHSAGLAAIGRF